MPIRMLRDWTDSEPVNSLEFMAEVLFVRLIMKADDYGRFTANPRLIRALCFPLKDGVRESDISRQLAECEKAGLIVLYEVDTKPLLEIVNFGQRLRNSRAKYPSREVAASCRKLPQVAATSRLNGIESDVETESEARSEPRDTFLTGPSDHQKRFREAYPKKAKPRDCDRAFLETVAVLVGERGWTDDRAAEFLIDRAEAYAASPSGMPPPPGNDKDWRPEPANWLNSGKYDEPVSEWQKPNVSTSNDRTNHDRRSAGRKQPTERTADQIDLDAMLDSIPITGAAKKPTGGI